MSHFSYRRRTISAKSDDADTVTILEEIAVEHHQTRRGVAEIERASKMQTSDGRAVCPDAHGNFKIFERETTEGPFTIYRPLP